MADPRGRQALLALAHLRCGDSYAQLAAGFGIGIATVFRYWAAARSSILTPDPTLRTRGQPDAPAVTPGHPGRMSAPIVVHFPSSVGGRAVTINGEIAGLARDDRDLVEFLRRAGIYDAEQCLDDPQWIEWRGGRAHHYEAA
jgi:hypothetical protein